MDTKELIHNFVRGGATEGKNRQDTLGIYGDYLVHYNTVIAKREPVFSSFLTQFSVSNHGYSITTKKVIQVLLQNISSTRLAHYRYVPHEHLNVQPFRKLDNGAKLHFNPDDLIFLI